MLHRTLHEQFLAFCYQDSELSFHKLGYYPIHLYHIVDIGLFMELMRYDAENYILQSASSPLPYALYLCLT